MGTNVINAKPTVRQSAQHAESFNMELNTKFETNNFLVALPSYCKSTMLEYQAYTTILN